jgi:hypothetical protein
MKGRGMNEDLPQPPFEQLHRKLLAFTEILRHGGDEAGAGTLENMVAGWWQEQGEWNEALCQRLHVCHEINNALVGVRGNVQLLLMGPLGSEPDTRARLEVVIRESSRIKKAAGLLREIRTRIETPTDGKHVA